MTQRNITRGRLSPSLSAACLVVAAVAFAGACIGGSDAANEQTGSGQANSQTTPTPQTDTPAARAMNC